MVTAFIHRLVRFLVVGIWQVADEGGMILVFLLSGAALPANSVTAAR